MSAASLKRFQEKVAAGVAVTLSVYEDANGLWAKDTEFVERVRVKFIDQETLFLTMGEVMTLTTEQRAKIDHAPSSEPA